MARSELIRKILEDFPAGFVLGLVRAKPRHNSYTQRCGLLKNALTFIITHL